MTMKEAQISTVTTAAVSPRALGQSFIETMIGELGYAYKNACCGSIKQRSPKNTGRID